MEAVNLSPSLTFSRSAGHPSLSSTWETRSCPAPWALVSSRFAKGRALGEQGEAGPVLWEARSPVPAHSHCSCPLGCSCLGPGLSGGRYLLSSSHHHSHPGECYELHIHCKTNFVGYFPATVLWELLGPGESGSEGAGTFYIARFLAAVAHSPLAAQLKPSAPFQRTRITGNPVLTNRIEEGERPDR